MKVVWGVILFNLLSIGLALLSIILHPAELKAFMTTDISEQAQMMVQKADQQTGGIREQIEKANVLKAATPTPVRTPPPAVDPEKLLEPTVEAYFEGDYFGEQAFNTPPPASLYPMSLRRREISEDGMIELEILMKNGSGFQFMNVNIFLRSPDYPRTQLFTLDRWKNNEIALLKYVFPEDEQEVRLKNLRILKVTGEQVDSVLSRQMREKQDELNQLSGKIEIEGEVDPAFANMMEVVLVLPEEMESLPAVPELELDDSTQERQNVRSQYENSYASLHDAQEKLMQFVQAIEDDGYESTLIDGDGLDLIRQIMSSKTDFSNQATRLTLLASRSKDEEVKKITALLREKSKILEEQIKIVNSQIPQSQYKISDQALTSNQ